MTVGLFSNAKPHRPRLFQDIVECDDDIEWMAEQPVVALKDWRGIKQERRDLSRQAEVALRPAPGHQNRAQ